MRIKKLTKRYKENNKSNQSNLFFIQMIYNAPFLCYTQRTNTVTQKKMYLCLKNPKKMLNIFFKIFANVILFMTVLILFNSCLIKSTNL